MEKTRQLYFEFLVSIVEGDPRYSNLLLFLFEFPFAVIVPRDSNRVYDGVQLRYLFGDSLGMSDEEIESYFDNEECSVLEIMVALANRCNQEILYDEDEGNQAADIFRAMIRSLGLVDMTNENFGERETEFAITRFVNREYQPDGLGGLFYIPDCQHDLREVELWYQMMWYLNTID